MENPQQQNALSSQTTGSSEGRKAFIIPFHARIQVQTQVIRDEQLQRATIQLSGEAVTLEVAGNVRQQLATAEAEQTYTVQLWFRTREGIVEDLQLSHIRKPKEAEELEQPTFSIGGRIIEVDRKEGLVTLNIEPNTVGLLQEAFQIQVWATLEQLEDKRIRPGRTLIVEGQYRPGSSRLVAQKFIHRRVGPIPTVK